jgi:hypothetical protein
VLAAALVAGAAAVLGACSAAPTPTIDGARIEQKIQAEAAGSDTAVEKVSCPSGRAAKANESFQCTATVTGGTTLTYDVLIASDQGDYTYKLAPNQTLDGERVAAEVQADVAASSPDFATAAITCPKRVVAPTGSATFECALVLGNQSATVVVTKAPGQLAEWSFKK